MNTLLALSTKEELFTKEEFLDGELSDEELKMIVDVMGDTDYGDLYRIQ